MKQITIHIRIGGRSYPATIDPGREEVVRKAARTLEASMTSLKQSYPGLDIQDQLALTALNVQSGLLEFEHTAERSLLAVEAALIG